MNIIAIIQARLGSTRLPGKVFLEIEGKTILEHVILRVKHSNVINNTVVATTNNEEDKAIEKFCNKIGIGVYCGNEQDVLDRYYKTAKLFKADHIMRITSDCPLIDPDIIDNVVNIHLESGADYTTNTLNETYPDGEDVEVIRFASLEIAWKDALLQSEREHVTPYIRNNPNKFKIFSVENETNLSDKRWTLDNEEDFIFIKKIYENLYKNNPLFGMSEILDFLDKNKELEEINSHITRNEGYIKSLKEDKKL